MLPKVVTFPLHRVQRGHGKGFTRTPPRGPVRRPARIAVMLALAYKIREAIAHGQVHSQADAAGRLGVTPARLTQLLDLLHLAPDLQERLLFLEAVDGLEPLTEHNLRALTREPCWAAQRVAFARVAAPGSETRPSIANGSAESRAGRAQTT